MVSDEKKLRILFRIKQLHLAFKLLNEEWLSHENELDSLANEYPFDQDFSELTNEVGYWYDHQVEYLLKN